MVRGPRTVMRSGPRLPQLEKALAQKRRPNIAINQLINKKINLKKKKKKKVGVLKIREICAEIPSLLGIVGPAESYLSFLSLSFLICKRE